MKAEKIIKALEKKVSGIKKLKGLNSKHFAFRNWHATVMQLLRELPSSFAPEVGDYKKLTFEDTGFKRGRKFLTSPDTSRFVEDLDNAEAVLKKVIRKVRSGMKAEEAGKKEAEETSAKSPKSGGSKPSKPSLEKGSGKKTAGKTSVSKGSSKRKKQSRGARKPAKTGSSAARKKKKS